LNANGTGGAKAIEDSVKKSTKSKAVPPKRKHVRVLVLEAHKDHGGNAFFNEVFRRPIDRDEIVAWKTLVVCHHLMSEGPRGVLEDAVYRETTFQGILNTYGKGHAGLQGPKHYAAIIEQYVLYLKDKIKFHQTHPEYPPDFKLETFLKHKDSRDIKKNLSAITHMNELQAGICRVGTKLFDQKDMIDCKVSCLIPLIIESYNIYTIMTHLIRNLVEEVDSMEVLTFVIEQFYAQYITLRNFFYDSSGVKYVTSVIAVPNLPQEPPEFFGKRKVTRSESKPAPVQQPVVQQVVVQPPPTLSPVKSFDPFFDPQPTQRVV